MKLILAAALVALTAHAAPPTVKEAAVPAAPSRVRVVRDPTTQLPRALFGLAIPIAGKDLEKATRAALESQRTALGLTGDLGRAKVTKMTGRTVYSFEIVAVVAGQSMPVADRRVTATVVGATLRTILSDFVPFAASVAASNLPLTTSGRAAQDIVHNHFKAPVGEPEALLLVVGPGHAEPIWRVPVAVLPQADHRVADVSRRDGRIIRVLPLSKDGARLEGVR